ncbi:MAG TPA: leucyl aminopeptidase [Candidatus Limenecus avicola]|uniref:Probable cytosol aminopeptidase n=1 Tax=Candidatus Limenecus avicola TaxID=2840847 RepID=A0A9D1MZU1_9CLOT|nr:leucyl aminopeptidase [Candidatus Limenecus avicola]
MSEKIEISVSKGLLEETPANVLVVNLFEGVKIPAGATGAIDIALDGLISKFIIAKEGFDGKFGKMYLLPTYGKIAAEKVLLVGLGKNKDFTPNRLRELSAKIIKKCRKMGNAKKVISVLHGAGIGGYDPEISARMIAEGTLIGSYSFDKYKTEKSSKKVDEFVIVDMVEENCKKAKAGVKKGKIIGSALNFARDLSNEQPAYATPSKLAEIAQSFKDLEVKVYDKDEIEKMGMGAFLGVAKGSSQPPKFIHMHYKGSNQKLIQRKIAIIGKGICFDSGGLDIKPPSSMLNMKDDMSGAAAVLGVMSVLKDLKPNCEVHGIIAACENMPGCSAYKPGDVLTAKNGKTIEVDNTDAEGRLTLADALCYACELDVDEVIDIATLTGACVVALGSAASGIMGNHQPTIDKLIKCANSGGEKMWQLPMFDEYKESLQSDVADMRNTGSRMGGAQIAGIFLQNFVKKVHWAHIDVAGTAFLDKPQNEFPKGATGAGVRTLINYLML